MKKNRMAICAFTLSAAFFGIGLGKECSQAFAYTEMSNTDWIKYCNILKQEMDGRCISNKECSFSNEAEQMSRLSERYQGLFGGYLGDIDLDGASELITVGSYYKEEEACMSMEVWIHDFEEGEICSTEALSWKYAGESEEILAHTSANAEVSVNTYGDGRKLIVLAVSGFRNQSEAEYHMLHAVQYKGAGNGIEEAVFVSSAGKEAEDEKIIQEAEKQLSDQYGSEEPTCRWVSEILLEYEYQEGEINYGSITYGDGAQDWKTESSETWWVETVDGIQYGSGYAWDNANIIAYVGEQSDLIVPNEIAGRSVTKISNEVFKDSERLRSVVLGENIQEIGMNAFDNCKELREITFSNCLNTIDSYAFNKCVNLQTIELPESLKQIDSYAFENCDSLRRVNIPSEVTSIGYNPFLFCGEMQEITVSPDNSRYAAIEGVLFDKSEKSLIAYPTGKGEKKYEIPYGIKKVGNYGIAQCEDLCSIVIPDTVTELRYGAFWNCYNLMSIDIPENVEYIGEAVLGYCYDLSSIWVADENRRYGVTNGCLFDKELLTTLAYEIASSNNECVIPEGIIRIGDYTFSGSEDLENVIISDSVTSIGFQAFKECESLEKISIPEAVTEIDASAFDSSYLKKMIVTRDSYAESWAQSNGFEIEYADANDWLLE